MKNRDVSDFELRKKLNEAIAKNRYFITITIMDGRQLHHFTTTRNFPVHDIIPTLEHIATEMEKGFLADAEDHPEK